MPPTRQAVLALFIAAAPLLGLAAPTEIVRPDWSQHFARESAQGTLLILDQRSPDAPRQVYAPERAATRYAPASTFKLPHTLIALEQHAVADEFSRIIWDGRRHGAPAWNRDQDLRSAMRHSVVWVYQDLARKIGETAERAALAHLDYGNRTIGARVDDFWLDGSLRVSAHEQIDFLERLYRNRLPFELAHQRLVKDLMVVEAGRDFILRAKTGWFNRNGESVGWWVGWVERPEGPVFFALNLDMPGGIADAPKRETIVRAALRELGALPAP